MTKTWIIHQLERKASNGFVINVHWRLAISDTSQTGQRCYADTYSVASYTQSEEDFIPFEDLTEEMVIEWVKQTLGQEQVQVLEESLVEQIELQKSPPVLIGLPWEDEVELQEGENETGSQLEDEEL